MYKLSIKILLRTSYILDCYHLKVAKMLKQELYARTCGEHTPVDFSLAVYKIKVALLIEL